MLNASFLLLKMETSSSKEMPLVRYEHIKEDDINPLPSFFVAVVASLGRAPLPDRRFGLLHHCFQIPSQLCSIGCGWIWHQLKCTSCPPAVGSSCQIKYPPPLPHNSKTDCLLFCLLGIYVHPKQHITMLLKIILQYIIKGEINIFYEGVKFRLHLLSA